MDEIKIQVPPGYEIDTLDKVSGVLKFKAKPRKVTDLIKTFEDALVYHGINKEEFERRLHGLSSDEIAYSKLTVIVSALNEKWTPDWNSSGEYKYYPYFDMRGGSSGFRFYVCDAWASVSYVGSRLCFKTRELAQYAGQQFTDLYKQFMIIQ